MVLTEAQRERVREIEIIRAEAAEEVRTRSSQKMVEQMSALYSGGPSAGVCPNCYGEMRSRWKYCPFCSHPARALCLFCGGRVPDIEGARFCPDCGNRVS